MDQQPKSPGKLVGHTGMNNGRSVAPQILHGTGIVRQYTNDKRVLANLQRRDVAISPD